MARPAVACSAVKGPVLSGCCAASIAMEMPRAAVALQITNRRTFRSGIGCSTQWRLAEKINTVFSLLVFVLALERQSPDWRHANRQSGEWRSHAKAGRHEPHSVRILAFRFTSKASPTDFHRARARIEFVRTTGRSAGR